MKKKLKRGPTQKIQLALLSVNNCKQDFAYFRINNFYKKFFLDILSRSL